jgi:hypothetical protein
MGQKLGNNRKEKKLIKKKKFESIGLTPAKPS